MRRLLALALLDDRYPALHGARVLAIVGVVQYHVTTILTSEARLPLDVSYGALSMSVFFGMNLFFVLSGFLIGSILLRSLETTGLVHVGRFWLRRAFRILPLYYVVLALLALTTHLTASQKQHLPWETLFLTNYAPVRRTDVVMPWGWSLAVEEHFYLAAPLLFFILSKLRSPRVAVAALGLLWLSALGVRFGLFALHPKWSPGALYDHEYFETHTRYDTLVAGVLLAYVHARWREPLARWLTPAWRRAALAFVSLACLWLLLRPWAFGTQGFALLRILSWGTVTSVMYLPWLLLLLRGNGWMARGLAARPWRTVATLGYGVYLLHIPLCRHLIVPLARWLANVRGWPVGVVWSVSLGVLLVTALVAAYVGHLVVEKPALWLRDRLAP